MPPPNSNFNFERNETIDEHAEVMYKDTCPSLARLNAKREFKRLSNNPKCHDLDTFLFTEIILQDYVITMVTIGRTLFNSGCICLHAQLFAFCTTCLKQVNCRQSCNKHNLCGFINEQ